MFKRLFTTGKHVGQQRDDPDGRGNVFCHAAGQGGEDGVCGLDNDMTEERASLKTTRPRAVVRLRRLNTAHQQASWRSVELTTA